MLAGALSVCQQGGEGECVQPRSSAEATAVTLKALERGCRGTRCARDGGAERKRRLWAGKNRVRAAAQRDPDGYAVKAREGTIQSRRDAQTNREPVRRTRPGSEGRTENLGSRRLQSLSNQGDGNGWQRSQPRCAGRSGR